jgi:phosphoglycolate phosphatase
MKYKGIIFDLDGTLADTLDDIAGSMNQVLVRHNYPIHPVNDYKLLVGRGLENLVKQALPVNARGDGNIAACLAEMVDDYSTNCIVKTQLYHGISDMFNELIRLNMKVSVFSNKDEALTIKIVRHLLPAVPFIIVAGARSDVPKKPDPSGALYVCREMNLVPQEIVYVGDSDVDMITACRAGMYAVGVTWGFRDREELQKNGAHMIIDHPDELIKLLRK